MLQKEKLCSALDMEMSGKKFCSAGGPAGDRVGLTYGLVVSPITTHLSMTLSLEIDCFLPFFFFFFFFFFFSSLRNFVGDVAVGHRVTLATP